MGKNYEKTPKHRVKGPGGRRIKLTLVTAENVEGTVQVPDETTKDLEDYKCIAEVLRKGHYRPKERI